ncbi:hypothetical protein E2320_017241 [Naja naja]|nr:hypothetical protein E2320_017241 [Naja naja]
MAEGKDKDWVGTEEFGEGEDSSEKRLEKVPMGEMKELLPAATQPAVRPKAAREVRLSDQSFVPKGGKPRPHPMEQTLDWKVKRWPGAEEDWWGVPQSDTMVLLRHQFGDMTRRGLMDSGSVGRRQALASGSSLVNMSSPLEFQDSEIGTGLE